ncbi:hypothetical protein FKM82_005435 [Ascaphus truei]
MLFLKIAFILALCERSQTQEQTYLVTGPRIWRVGASEVVVVQAFGQQGDFPIRISLNSYPDKKTKYASQHLVLTPANKHQGKVNLMIQPKDIPREGSSQQYVFLEAQTATFTKEEKVPITYKNGFIFIQTDKPIYTPEQSVKIRVYSLDEELKPALRTTVLTFVDPDGVKVDVVEAKDLTGVISFPDFKIPANPKRGMWRIEAAYEKDFTTSSFAEFEVKEYVLPSFFVSIEPELNLICYDKFEVFMITVRANYFHSQKVDRANVYIRFGIIQDGLKKMMPRSIQVKEMIDGEAVFQFNSKHAVKELGYKQLEDLDGSYLYITTSVQEFSEGRTEESENADVNYVLTPYTLKLVGTPLFVKPALPFYVKVQVKDTLDKPVGRVPVKLTATGITADKGEIPLNDESLEKGITDRNDGTALFILNIPPNIESLEFKIMTADNTLPEENQAKAEYTAISYSSLGKSYLYIDWATEYKVLGVGDFLNVKVFPSSPYLPKLKHYSYLIISKGKIVHFGTVDRFHESTFQSLNILITQDMVPSARLLVYYIITGDTTAELVSDSVWMNVEEKCVNNQKVKMSTKRETFKPKTDISLTLNAQTNSLLALSAMDMAVYEVAKKSKRPLERVLNRLEESDLGCGAGGGKDNADVFRLAGLTFITNANARASQSFAINCNEVLRPKRSASFQDEIQKEANKYRDKRVRNCCMDGVRACLGGEDCDTGAKRISQQKGERCVAAFKSCCILAKSLKEKASKKVIGLGRMFIRTLFDIDEPDIRSYFPESWLWEVHSITDRLGSKTFSITLPDSLTTWEIQGIGVSDKGICVADPIKIQVFKDLFLDVQLPYSVVRGEQIQIKTSVYNYKNAKVKGCVTMSVGKEICLFGSSSTSRDRTQTTSCNRLHYFPVSTLKTFTFNILPLELGLHTVNFTLAAEIGSEIVVKTLRVVPEGIKKERNAAYTLDPQGIYGTIRRRQELNYNLPPNTVPKSNVERILSVKGNLLGEVISTVLNSEGINYLTSLPKGSAETELMRVVPIFYVYHYLETVDNWDLLGPNTLTSQFNMRRQMKEGVTSILSFRNTDYSYSVWRDGDPSTWLTAFAMRIFGDVRKYVSIDHMSVCNTLLWLAQNCQSKDGSFKDKSSYQPVKLQGTSPIESNEKTLYLTAFVFIGFQKAYDMCPVVQVKETMNRAEEYLSKNVANAQSSFTLAICAYALALSNSFFTSTRYALATLKREANVLGVGDPPMYRFWKDSFKKFDATVPNAGTAQIVETTAYALLTCLKLGEKQYANPVVRWLSEQQRYGGGFYSTQDTVIALEALTEVAILNKKLTLDMVVNVSYRKKGDFQRYVLSEKAYLTRPIEVPLTEDLVIATGSSTGIATAHVTTVYHLISTSEETCSFDLKVERKPNSWDRDESTFDEDALQTMRLEACAKYKPKGSEGLSTSGHAVMEISLVTGLEADEKDLAMLTQRVDQLVTDYSITDGRVILHFDWISSDEYVCAAFHVREVFHVGMLSPAIFKVYEFHAPEKECTIFYNPYGDEKLLKLCNGDECRCMEVECAKVQSKMDMTITADDRKDTACRNDVVYAFKVKILASREDGNFVKYTAVILDIFKKGEASVKANTEVTFMKKKTCLDVEINVKDQYLIMGKEGIRIRILYHFQYEYPLDSSTWIEWWPSNADCGTRQCNQFLSILEEFSENVLLVGC